MSFRCCRWSSNVFSDTLPKLRALTKLCNESHSQSAPAYAKCLPEGPASLDYPPSTPSQPNAVPGAPMFASAGSSLSDQQICQELIPLLIHLRSKQVTHPLPLYKQVQTVLRVSGCLPLQPVATRCQIKAKSIILQACANDLIICHLIQFH